MQKMQKVAIMASRVSSVQGVMVVPYRVLNRDCNMKQKASSQERRRTRERRNQRLRRWSGAEPLRRTEAEVVVSDGLQEPRGIVGRGAAGAGCRRSLGGPEVGGGDSGEEEEGLENSNRVQVLRLCWSVSHPRTRILAETSEGWVTSYKYHNTSTYSTTSIDIPKCKVIKLHNSQVVTKVLFINKHQKMIIKVFMRLNLRSSASTLLIT
ncbi:hypothetical protein LXL04_036601 [Taraxacum kok-saghyz]